jgi:hypothetical protein
MTTFFFSATSYYKLRIYSSIFFGYDYFYRAQDSRVAEHGQILSKY